REESRCGLEDLVGPAELEVLALQDLQPVPFTGREAGTPAFVGLGLAHPAPERLMRHAELVGDRADRGPLRVVLVLMVEHHPHGPLAHFAGIPSWSWHGSNLSRFGASKKPGAVQPVNGVVGADPGPRDTFPAVLPSAS